MNKKYILIGLVILVVVFYSGYMYGKAKSSASQFSGMNRNGFQVGSNTANQRFMRQGNNFSGEVISLDDKSLTIKMRDGGSRIVFLLASTTFSKMSPSSLGDIKVGSQVSVFGSSNSDGSLNASSIQEIPARPIQ